MIIIYFMGKIGFDKNHLLCIQEDNIPQYKEYLFDIGGYKIKNYDERIFVYNKRQWKLVHLKELSEGMQVCFFKDKPLLSFPFDINMLKKALMLYQGYNEETGEKYFFLPFFSKKVEIFDQELREKFGLQCEIRKTSQGVFVSKLDENISLPESNEEILSFLFSLVFIYGKIDEKNGQVVSLRAHIPSLGICRVETMLEDYLEKIQNDLGLFILGKQLQSGGKNIFQLSTNDPEVLKLFLEWINCFFPDKVFSLDLFFKKKEEITQQLVDFVKGFLGEFDGVDEVIRDLNRGVLKFIKY